MPHRAFKICFLNQEEINMKSKANIWVLVPEKVSPERFPGKGFPEIYIKKRPRFPEKVPRKGFPGLVWHPGTHKSHPKTQSVNQTHKRIVELRPSVNSTVGFFVSVWKLFSQTGSIGPRGPKNGPYRATKMANKLCVRLAFLG